MTKFWSLVYSEDTIQFFVSQCEDIPVVMAASFSANRKGASLHRAGLILSVLRSLVRYRIEHVHSN